MLDAPGYPKAIKFKNFKVELYDAKLNSEHLNAKIKISTKDSILVIVSSR